MFNTEMAPVTETVPYGCENTAQPRMGVHKVSKEELQFCQEVEYLVP